MEKLVYALILAARKLRPYFQAHRIEVRTAYPLRQILHKPESSGRMLKWAIELGQFDLEYCPRTAIKGQALADFVLEFDEEIDDKAIVPAESTSQESHQDEKKQELPHPWWTLHVDRAVNNSGSGAGIILITPEGHRLMSAIHLKFYATNNDAEYEALINGLKLALEVGAVNLIVRSDSELVINQVNGGFQARGPRTELYMRCARRLLGKFSSARLESVPREENSNADALAKMGSQMDNVQLGQIPLGIQEIPSIPEVEVCQMQEIPKENWMTPIHNYIQSGAVPEDKLQARRLRYQATKYVKYDRVLYKRGLNQPLLRCVDREEGNYILREVHEGICGNHSGGGSLAFKVLRQGYYWPTMREDAFNFVRACDRCQRFANYSNIPTTTITSTGPFAMWRIDLIGELPKAKGGGEIHCGGCGLLHQMGRGHAISHNHGKKDKGFCVQLHSMQSNGQTEAINKIIKHTLKVKLEEKKGDWPEEMPMILWSYNTTARTTTGETPFLLTYGYEAMVPVEVGAGSLRRDVFVEEDAEVNQRLHLDLLDEARTNSQLKLAAYQQRVARYFNKRVKSVPFKVGDLVLRKVMPNTKIAQHGVLGANWEGPYKVKAILFLI
ncbi:uncharacterized protein LOC141695382 [Apium graveolens]|uniref:uncharacterized protein LOC141695382 n=1 Tax=Apium graveolens TaxID=4045 RepID=UPI003D7A22D6